MSFSGLSQDFLRTFSGLSQEFFQILFRIFSGQPQFGTDCLGLVSSALVYFQGHQLQDVLHLLPPPRTRGDCQVPLSRGPSSLLPPPPPVLPPHSPVEHFARSGRARVGTDTGTQLFHPTSSNFFSFFLTGFLRALDRNSVYLAATVL